VCLLGQIVASEVGGGIMIYCRWVIGEHYSWWERENGGKMGDFAVGQLQRMDMEKEF